MRSGRWKDAQVPLATLNWTTSFTLLSSPCVHSYKAVDFIPQLLFCLTHAIRFIPRATRGDQASDFLNHKRFVSHFLPLGCWISPSSFDPAAALPAKRQLNPMSLRCHPNAELWHKETSSPAISAATGSIIGATHSPIRKTRGHLPFVSAWFVCIPFPFPLHCLVCFPLDCWQTVDAPCCGEAESVGVDGQD